MRNTCILQRLDASDPGFARPYNYRFRVEQIDGDCHYFLTEDRARSFGRIHGLRFVSDAEMEGARQELYGGMGS